MTPQAAFHWHWTYIVDFSYFLRATIQFGVILLLELEISSFVRIQRKEFIFCFYVRRMEVIDPTSGFSQLTTNIPISRKHFSGEDYLRFFANLSYMCTSTSIVAGALAERLNLVLHQKTLTFLTSLFCFVFRSNFKAFLLVAVCNSIMYCFPAHWIWGKCVSGIQTD